MEEDHCIRLPCAMNATSIEGGAARKASVFCTKRVFFASLVAIALLLEALSSRPLCTPLDIGRHRSQNATGGEDRSLWAGPPEAKAANRKTGISDSLLTSGDGSLDARTKVYDNVSLPVTTDPTELVSEHVNDTGFRPTIATRTVSGHRKKSKLQNILNSANPANNGSKKADYPTKNSPKLILYWNEFFQNPYFGFGTGSEPFLRHKCHVSSCLATSDKSLFKEADAVIFHFVPGSTLRQNMPARGHPGQVFVFFLMESPLHVFTRSRNMSDYNDIFNLTMTYRQDSDIWIPHGLVNRRSSPRVLKVSNAEILKNKSKMAAWVVSNCRGYSHRMNYVKELARYVDVDMYGACGTLSCPRDPPPGACFPQIHRKYKFYIAFENSICRDYMTEKVFRPLGADIVPVVLGGGDYAGRLPAKSYIDTRDFTNPKQLAKYLTYLNGRDEEYLKYFRWKASYDVTMIGRTRPRGFCRLCEILHDENFQFRSNFDIKKWWQDDGHCLTDSRLGQWLRYNNWKRKR